MTDGTRVDFYILATTDPASRLLFACRLTEKAYGLKHTVYAHTTSADTARKLDDLMWTFRQGSFIPHGLLDDADERTPVKIGGPKNAQTSGQLLINLGDDAPEFATGYDRVAEIIDGSPASKQAGRDRFKRYRAMGIEPVTHNID